jgi:hypothetical protein
MIRSHVRIALLVGAAVGFACTPFVCTGAPPPVIGPASAPVSAPVTPPTVSHPGPGKPGSLPSAGSEPTDTLGGPKSNRCATFARTMSGGMDTMNPAYEDAYNECMQGN